MNCFDFESCISADPSLIDDAFPDYIKNILNTYEGEPINDVYKRILKHSAVKRFITYIEYILNLLRDIPLDSKSNDQPKMKERLLKFLNINSLEQIYRTIVLCELTIDILKSYNTPKLNTTPPDPWLGCSSCCYIL